MGSFEKLPWLVDSFSTFINSFSAGLVELSTEASSSSENSVVLVELLESLLVLSEPSMKVSFKATSSGISWSFSKFWVVPELDCSLEELFKFDAT